MRTLPLVRGRGRPPARPPLGRAQEPRTHAGARGPPRAGRVLISPLSWEFLLKTKHTGEVLVLPVLLWLPSGYRPASGASGSGGPPTPLLLWASAGLRAPLPQAPGGPAKLPAARKEVQECPVGRGRRTLRGRQGHQASQYVRPPRHSEPQLGVEEAGTLPPPGGGVRAEVSLGGRTHAGAVPTTQSSLGQCRGSLSPGRKRELTGPRTTKRHPAASPRASGCWACHVQSGLCPLVRRRGACWEPGSGAAGHRDPIGLQVQ